MIVVTIAACTAESYTAGRKLGDKLWTALPLLWSLQREIWNKFTDICSAQIRTKMIFYLIAGGGRQINEKSLQIRINLIKEHQYVWLLAGKSPYFALSNIM